MFHCSVYHERGCWHMYMHIRHYNRKTAEDIESILIMKMNPY